MFCESIINRIFKSKKEEKVLTILSSKYGGMIAKNVRELSKKTNNISKKCEMVGETIVK